MAKAAVETVAENTSDGVVAPLIFMAIGGAPLGFLYKAINTMDSMVGYKNDKYIRFGRAAARLDDAANFIPARLSALLMILAVYILRFDGGNARRIYRRDRHNHKSPNSAQTESCAPARCTSSWRGRLCISASWWKNPPLGTGPPHDGGGYPPDQPADDRHLRTGRAADDRAAAGGVGAAAFVRLKREREGGICPRTI